MKKLILISMLILNSAFAAPSIPLDQQLGELKVVEVTAIKQLMSLYADAEGDTPHESPTKPPVHVPTPSTPTPTPDDSEEQPKVDRTEQAGKIISVAKDLIALGEAIYDLVKKGKPTNVTEYAAISVVPKDPTTKQYVDPFDLEGFSIPEERSFVASITNLMGKEVVRFEYKVIYSYGGSYQGVGKYLTNVIIVPGSIRTGFGWDFNATMKLSGIMNHGTKADPVAGVLVAIKYQMNSWSAAFERNDTIHITGRGEVKSFVTQ